MKNFISLLGGILLGCLLTLGAVYLYETNGPGADNQEKMYEYVDSLVQATNLDYANPVMETADEVVIMRDLYAGKKADDEVFLSMPEDVLRNVAGTLIKRQGSVSKSELVLEYTQNKQVYDYLPTNTSAPDSISAEHKDVSKVLSTSYHRRTDTIDGKPVKIMVKTEESVE